MINDFSNQSSEQSKSETSDASLMNLNQNSAQQQEQEKQQFYSNQHQHEHSYQTQVKLQQQHPQPLLAHGPLPPQHNLLAAQREQQQQQQLQQQQLLLLAAVAQQNSPLGFQARSLSSHEQSTVSANGHTNGILTHNLIPHHLQTNTPTTTLDGTPGHNPALILSGQAPNQVPSLHPPVLTVQERPHVPPIYNGVNINYPGVQMLHVMPPVYVVENFLTPYECDFLISAANDSWSPAPVVGKGVGEISASRTSSTCYLAREDLPDYMRKVSLLTGKPVSHCELPQVGRYLHSQQYLQHFDAFDLNNEDGRRFASNGGQRVVTVLVYLNDVPQGGATSFPTLNLQVQPRRGMALVFFPATVDGLLDRNALHAALPAQEPYAKYISQVWIRQSDYSGTPSKRLPQTLGTPFPNATPQQSPHQQQEQQSMMHL